MLAKLLLPLLWYQFYNIACGVPLAIWYWRKEKCLVARGEFILLLLWPCIGLGNWIHEQRTRLGEPSPSRAAIILKRMGLLNIGWVLVLLWVTMHHLPGVAEWAARIQEAPTDPATPPMAEMIAVLILFLLITGGYIILLLVFFILAMLVFVVGPWLAGLLVGVLARPQRSIS